MHVTYGQESFREEMIDGELKIGKGVKFERIRRITGYLVGSVDRFNDAKRAEVRDRVKHFCVDGMFAK